MRKKKLFLAGIVLCLLVAAITGFYWYHKPRTSLLNVKPDYTISAKNLYEAFQQDEKKANLQYLEKVIEVNGPVDNLQITDSTISCILSSGNEMGGINCSIIKAGKDQTVPAKGTVVTIKGKCTGYLMDVNLTDAVIEH